MSKYRVGEDLFIDGNHKLVYKNGVELKLTELSYRLLITLVENAPEIVSHDQLINAVWKNRVVSDENLKKRVSRLRETLADNPEEAKYIGAERGMGYRCIAPVIRVNNVEPEQHLTANNSNNSNNAWHKIPKLSKLITSVFCLLLISIATILFTGSWSSTVKTPNNTIAQDYLFQADQHYLRFNASDNQNAVSLYQQAIAAKPKFAASYSGLANSYAQGYQQFGYKEFWLERATELAKQGVELAPNQAWSYNALAFSQFLSGHYIDAINNYHKAIQLEPNWSTPRAYLALVHLQTGKVILAYQSAGQAVEKDPANPLTITVLALCYREMQMPKQAKNRFQQVLKQSADFLLAKLYFAELALAIGDNIQAKTLLDDITHNQTNSQLSFWINALLTLQANNISAALENFQQTSQKGGRYALPAMVYQAIISKDQAHLQQLYQLLSNKIKQGDQWPELIFDQALILLVNNDIDGAIEKFKQAAIAGFSHEYRFEQLRLFSNLSEHTEFKRLLADLSQSNKQKQLKRIPRKTQS